MVKIWALFMEDETPASSESQLFAIEQKVCSKHRFARLEKRMNEQSKMNEAWHGEGDCEGTYKIFYAFSPEICPKTWIPSTYQKYVNVSFVANK